MYRWFWKCARFFFLRANYFMAISRDILRGQKSRGPLKISREMAHKVICPKTKNYLPNFQNQLYIGNFMSHCDQVPTTLNLKHLLVCEDFFFLYLHTKLSLYMYTAELAWTLSFDCWQISCFRRFFWERGGIKVERITLYTANTLNTTLTDLIPRSRQKKWEIRKLDMNLLGRWYKAKGHKTGKERVLKLGIQGMRIQRRCMGCWMPVLSQNISL